MKVGKACRKISKQTKPHVQAGKLTGSKKPTDCNVQRNRQKSRHIDRGLIKATAKQRQTTRDKQTVIQTDSQASQHTGKGQASTWVSRQLTSRLTSM